MIFLIILKLTFKSCSYNYLFLQLTYYYCDNPMTMTPNNRTNKPIFLIFVMGCSANLSKYARHLFGNNAGANPSIMSTKPKTNNISTVNPLTHNDLQKSQQFCWLF